MKSNEIGYGMRDTQDKKKTRNQAEKKYEKTKIEIDNQKNKCDLREREREKKTEAIDSLGNRMLYNNWNYSKYWNEKLLLWLR